MSSQKKIVVFSGAGMSAESGINTFRDTGGLWEQYKVEDVATPEAFRKNPELVLDFYNQRRKNILEAQPNSAHKAIAKLEKEFDVTVVTQNIDDLHERAGSKNVLHLHGEIMYAKSSNPDNPKLFPLNKNGIQIGDQCNLGFQLRPHVVWFGEEVPMLHEAEPVIARADFLIIIGTSLNVYPAAGLIYYMNPESKGYIIDPNQVEVSQDLPIEPIIAKATEGIEIAIDRIKKASL